MPQSHIDDPNEPKHMTRPWTMCGVPIFFLSSSHQISPTMTGEFFNARRANILRA